LLVESGKHYLQGMLGLMKAQEMVAD
jgi:hypothetical protein